MNAKQTQLMHKALSDLKTNNPTIANDFQLNEEKECITWQMDGRRVIIFSTYIGHEGIVYCEIAGRFPLTTG
jgi:hypothetical protein